MKLKFLAAAAAVSICAMAAAPAFAGDGFVEGDYVNVKPTGGAKAQDAWQALASYSTMPSAGSWGFQGDFTYADGDHVPSQFVGGQLTAYKQADNSRVGAYAAYDNQFGTDNWEGGATAQFFVKNWTFSGVAGGGRNTDTDVGYWLASANAVYYVSPNFSLAGAAGRSTSDHAVGTTAVLGAHAEWKPANMPVSFVLGYENDNHAGPGGMVNFINVGVRFGFGGGNQTLKDRDQHGLINDFSLRQHL
jgi:hypothetical protein